MTPMPKINPLLLILFVVGVLAVVFGLSGLIVFLFNRRRKP